MKATRTFAIISFISTLLFSGALAQEQCGSQAGGAMCPGGLCCSKFGYCGNAPEYCDDDCQSQCTPGGGATPTPTPATPTPTPSGGGDLGSLISQAVFNDMLKHRSDSSCQGGFYTYDSFLTAAKSFGGFATTGDTDIRKREIAAFFGQTSHETTGGSPNAADGPYAWGYCFIQEQNKADYCNASAEWPCAAGKQYYGRGPIQLTWNYNYGQAGKAIGEDLISNPDLVATDPVISFKTALWYWMTAQAPKPSCHDVITGQWTPTEADTAAGRVPGYGMTTNIINGGVECANRANDKVEDRIGYYKRYCTLLSVGTGDNLDCANQTPYS